VGTLKLVPSRIATPTCLFPAATKNRPSSTRFLFATGFLSRNFTTAVSQGIGLATPFVAPPTTVERSFSSVTKLITLFILHLYYTYISLLDNTFVLSLYLLIMLFIEIIIRVISSNSYSRYTEVTDYL